MLKELQDKLLALNVNSMTEKKGKLTYLSWAKAWEVLLKEYPDATYNIRKNENGTPEFGNSKFGYMVYTDVTIEGVTREMWLFVMDGANKPLKDEPYTYQVKEYKWINGRNQATGNMIDKHAEAINMFDINKTVMRCLVKNLAMFGLGLYIYAGEDIPSDDEYQSQPSQPKSNNNKTNDRKVSVKDLSDLAKKKHVPLSQIFEMYKKETGKSIDDLKWIKGEIKVKYYDMLSKMPDKV